MLNHRFGDIDLTSEEGQLLMAALAVLTSIEPGHILQGKWGSGITPDQAMQQINVLANKIFFEDDWKREEIIKRRDKRLGGLLDE